jgi:hypothetical protein
MGPAKVYLTTRIRVIFGESQLKIALFLLIDCFSRLIKAFDDWLIRRKFLKAGSTIFSGFVSERIPELIAMWILDEYA